MISGMISLSSDFISLRFDHIISRQGKIICMYSSSSSRFSLLLFMLTAAAFFMPAVALSLCVSCRSFFRACYCSLLFVLVVAFFLFFFMLAILPSLRVSCCFFFLVLADAFLVALAIAFLFPFVACLHCACCCSPIGVLIFPFALAIIVLVNTITSHLDFIIQNARISNGY